jgi:hypothetical protein
MVARKIYPGAWEERHQLLDWVLAKYLKFSARLDYLLFHYQRLREFPQGAVDRNMGLVISYHH